VDAHIRILYPEAIRTRVGFVREAVLGMLAFVTEAPGVRIAVGRHVAHMDARFAGI
jgi:hypothetical protein